MAASARATRPRRPRAGAHLLAANTKERLRPEPLLCSCLGEDVLVAPGDIAPEPGPEGFVVRRIRASERSVEGGRDGGGNVETGAPAVADRGYHSPQEVLQGTSNHVQPANSRDVRHGAGNSEPRLVLGFRTGLPCLPLHQGDSYALLDRGLGVPRHGFCVELHDGPEMPNVDPAAVQEVHKG